MESAIALFRGAMQIAKNRRQDLRIQTQPSRIDIIHALDENDYLADYVQIQRSQRRHFRVDLFYNKWDLEDMFQINYPDVIQDEDT